MENADWWVDNAAHVLHLGGRSFPCDRDIEALAPWKGHALLLSSDTDCLSLWDQDGLIRLTRVGVYPQDMAVQGDTACVCGGADGCLHLIDLPELRCFASIHLPGMPERIALHDGQAYVLTLITEPNVHTHLVSAGMTSGQFRELLTLSGIPGALAADDAGLWIGASEQVLHLPWHDAQPDLVVKGFGLPRRIELRADGVIVTDPLEGIVARITQNAPSAIEVLHRGEV